MRKPKDWAERANELLERLADYLEEAHGEDLETDHMGDGREGCTYCDAIDEARVLICPPRAPSST